MKDHHSSFVFPATRSPSFVIATMRVSHPTVSSILVLVVQVTTNSPSKNLFPTSRLTQETEKSSTNELHTRFAVEFVFVLRVAQVKKAKDFFSDELHTRARTWKPLSPPGLVYCQKKGGREKDKKKTKEGGLSQQKGDVRNKK
jgi:hypothetical protein